MKVAIIAFGHPDNVFSLCHHLADRVDLTLVYVLAGDVHRQGILDIRLEDRDFGLHTAPEAFRRYFPVEIVSFAEEKHKVWVLRMPSRKLTDWRNYRTYMKAASRLLRERFQVIHYNGFSPFILLTYLRFPARVAQFWTLHDYKHHSGERKPVAERINYFLAKQKSLIIVQHYEYLRRQVMLAFGLPDGKVRTLRSGPLDVVRSFSPDYRFCPEKPYILFFGRISRYKGVDVLLQAYSAIESDKPELVIAGGGDYWFDLEPYQQNPKVHILHFYIENKDLLGLLERASFVVVPYRDATHSAVIATAYALDKPVVASDVDGLNEVVIDGDTGRLVEPGSVVALQEVLEDLFARPEAIQAFADRIKREKRDGNISWDRITAQYLALYQERLTPE